MSEENVDLVRNMYALWDLDATPELIDQAFREYLDEHFELRLPPDYPHRSKEDRFGARVRAGSSSCASGPSSSTTIRFRSSA
jgi:hypothetical protein